MIVIAFKFAGSLVTPRLPVPVSPSDYGTRP
jgi:hypothetical protein